MNEKWKETSKKVGSQQRDSKPLSPKPHSAPSIHTNKPHTPNTSHIHPIQHSQTSHSPRMIQGAHIWGRNSHDNKHISSPAVLNYDTIPDKKKDKTLHNQMWYHGALPRNELEDKLTDEGDFAVRVTLAGDEKPHVIISARHNNENKHLVINKNSDKTWRIEDLSFPTVYDLIYHHYKSQAPLSHAVPVILRRGIPRPDWLLRNEDIKGMDTKLGEGAFGEVFKGTVGVVKNGRKYSMVAVIKKSKAIRTDEERKLVVNEAKLVMECRHRNVVKCIGIAADNFPILIVMEYCPFGELLKYLKNQKGKISSEQKLKWCVEAAGGMTVLESKRIIHRDIAARNLLLGNNLLIKISDFGMAKRDGFYKEEGRLTGVPVRWTAPETFNDGIWTVKTDVFSFGVLLWEIYSDGDLPWNNMESSAILDKVINGNRIAFSNEALKNGIATLGQRTMAHRTEDRPSFSEIYAQTCRLFHQSTGRPFYDPQDVQQVDEEMEYFPPR